MSMKRKTKFIIQVLLWIIRKLYIKSRNLHENKDKYRENDETKTISAQEVGIKIDF